MASVWCAMAHDRKDTKVVGHLTHGDAKRALEATAMRWKMSQPGRALEHIGLDEIHLVVHQPMTFNCAGDVKVPKPIIAGHLWIEPLSPPSAPSGGDIYRSAKTKGG